MSYCGVPDELAWKILAVGGNRPLVRRPALCRSRHAALPGILHHRGAHAGFGQRHQRCHLQHLRPCTARAPAFSRSGESVPGQLACLLAGRCSARALRPRLPGLPRSGIDPLAGRRRHRIFLRAVDGRRHPARGQMHRPDAAILQRDGHSSHPGAALHPAGVLGARHRPPYLSRRSSGSNNSAAILTSSAAGSPLAAPRRPSWASFLCCRTSIRIPISG